MPPDPAPQPPVATGPVAAGMAARLGALAPNVRGALWVLLSCLLFTCMGTLVKLLGARFDSFQLAFFRAAFGLLAVLPFVARARFFAVRTRRPGAHLFRGLMGAAGMFCGFYALTHLSYADAVSLSYARPLFLIPLAVLFLGETVRARRWAATGVGFVGVLIMMRPGGAIELATLVALLGAFFVAVVNVLVKQLSRTERPDTILFYFGVISTSVALVPALVVWRPPTLWELALLMAIGALAASAQYCTIRGFSIGEATAVVPFDYARLLLAGVIGLFVFGEYPDLWTVTGAGVIAAATLYIALREAKLGKTAPPPTPPVVSA